MSAVVVLNPVLRSLPARGAASAARGPRASAARATLRGVAVRAPVVFGSRPGSRGALVVRGDAIDDAAALATAGPSDKTGPAASVVVPKLPRSDCTRTVAKSEGFDLSTTSFGSIGLGVGLPLLMSGFLGYFNVIPTGSISSLLLIYGFIISLIGFALQYAKLEPLECVTYEDAAALRESQTTAILTQVRNDVTRYRYGDEQHLEEALAIIFRYNRPGGLRKNQAPKLVGIAEQVIVDRYALVLKFESPKMELSDWTDRREKIQAFFGPGVTCGITEVGEGVVEVELVSDGSDASGPGNGMEDMEVLPPLMPGLPPRYVKKGSA